MAAIQCADGLQTVRRGRTLGHFLLPFGQFTLPHPAVKIIDNRNP